MSDIEMYEKMRKKINFWEKKRITMLLTFFFNTNNGNSPHIFTKYCCLLRKLTLVLHDLANMTSWKLFV